MDDDVRALLDAIEAQWNAAEAYVKKVERLRRGLVVGASINEFRYAGRRALEAYGKIKAGENGDGEARKQAHVLLQEARQFCLRAQHDAMDAAVTYIDQALLTMEQEFGPDLLHDKFSNYLPLKNSLREISELMAQSRGALEKRDVLYQQIRDELITDLVDKHYELEQNMHVLQSALQRRVEAEKRAYSQFWINAFLAGIAVVIAVAALAYQIGRDQARPAPAQIEQPLSKAN